MNRLISHNVRDAFVDSTIFPNRGVLKYPYERHKLTRLENNEGKEITVEELVDHYYKDPDRYFEVDKCNAAMATTNDKVTTATTALAISRTSIELAKPLYLLFE